MPQATAQSVPSRGSGWVASANGGRVLREATHPLPRDGTDSDQWTTESPLLNGGRVLREATHPLPRDGTDSDQWHSDRWTLSNGL